MMQLQLFLSVNIYVSVTLRGVSEVYLILVFLELGMSWIPHLDKENRRTITYGGPIILKIMSPVGKKQLQKVILVFIEQLKDYKAFAALMETRHHDIIQIQKKIAVVNVPVVFEHHKATTNLD